MGGVALGVAAIDVGEACGEASRSGAAVADRSAVGAFELRLPFTATIDLAMLRATVGHSRGRRQYAAKNQEQEPRTRTSRI
jgi:hypothetical protein